MTVNMTGKCLMLRFVLRYILEQTCFGGSGPWEGGRRWWLGVAVFANVLSAKGREREKRGVKREKGTRSEPGYL